MRIKKKRTYVTKDNKSLAIRRVGAHSTNNNESLLEMYQ